MYELSRCVAACRACIFIVQSAWFRSRRKNRCSVNEDGENRKLRYGGMYLTFCPELDRKKALQRGGGSLGGGEFLIFQMEINGKHIHRYPPSKSHSTPCTPRGCNNRPTRRRRRNRRESRIPFNFSLTQRNPMLTNCPGHLKSGIFCKKKKISESKKLSR